MYLLHKPSKRAQCKTLPLLINWCKSVMYK